MPITPPPSATAKKILIVSQAQGPIDLNGGKNSGTDLIIYELAKEWRGKGYDITIVAPEGSTLPPDAQGEIPIVQIPGKIHTPMQSLPPEQRVVTYADDAIAGMWNYVEAHAHEYGAVLNLSHHPHSFSRTAVQARPEIPLPEGYNPPEEPYQPRELGVPILHHIQFGTRHIQTDRYIADTIACRPGTVAFCSRGQAGTYLDTYGESHGLTSAQHHTVPLGVDMAQHAEGYRSEMPEQPVIFAWGGRIVREKGLHLALEAVRRYNGQHPDAPPARLKIMGTVGNQPYWEEMKALYGDLIQPWPASGDAKRDADPYFRTLNQRELVQEVGNSHALLHTHIWTEAFGMMMAQALATGTPVIATDKGSPADFIENGRNGFVIPPGDLFHTVRERIHGGEYYAEDQSGNRLSDAEEARYQHTVNHSISTDEQLVYRADLSREQNRWLGGSGPFTASGHGLIFGPMHAMLNGMEQAVKLDRAAIRAHAETTLSTESMAGHFDRFVQSGQRLHALANREGCRLAV